MYSRPGLKLNDGTTVEPCFECEGDSYFPYTYGYGSSSHTVWETCNSCGGSGYDKKQYKLYSREQDRREYIERKDRKSKYIQGSSLPTGV